MNRRDYVDNHGRGADLRSMSIASAETTSYMKGGLMCFVDAMLRIHSFLEGV